MIVTTLVGGTMMWLQSRGFARWVQTFFVQALPKDMGIQADFDEFEIGFFPPSISIRNPRVHYQKENWHLTAERLKFTFYPLQMLTGVIRIRELDLQQGDVDIVLNTDALKKQPVKAARRSLSLKWEDLVQIRIDQFALTNTAVKIRTESAGAPMSLQFQAQRLQVQQVIEKGLSGYSGDFDVRNFSAEFPKEYQLPRKLEHLSARASINEKGVRIEAIEIENPGFSARLKGKIQGDVLDPTRLLLESDLILHGQLEPILQGIPTLRVKSNVQGDVSFQGKFGGDLLRLADTFRASGEFKSKQFRWGNWHLDEAVVEGHWASASRQEDMVLSVKHATLRSPEIARQRGQPADGGEIKVSAFEIPFGGNKPVSIDAQLQQAHIHWLAAAALQDVFPMDFRASGDLHAEFIPQSKTQPWKLNVETHLELPSFQLDNQRLGRTAALSRVVATDRMRLNAKLLVDDKAIRIEKAELTLNPQVAEPQTQLVVTGSIDFKTGYDLHADGKMNLKDLATLAENKVEGYGPLKADIKGPASRVWIHFYPKFQDAFFLNLRLGDLAGEILYDDGPHDLYFKNISLKRGSMQMDVAGKIALDTPDSVAMTFKIPRGDIHELIGVFDEMTRERWWFPSSLYGPIQGQISVKGGLSLHKLRIDTQLTGADWDYYGEKFRNVQFVGGYDSGKYFISDWSAQKGKGRLFGKLAFKEGESFDWSAATEHLTLTDLDHVARMDVPIRGNLDLSSKGQLVDGWTQSSSYASLNHTTIRGNSYPKSYLRIQSAKGLVSGQAEINEKQAALQFEIPTRTNRSAFVKGEANKLDLSALLLLVNPKLMKDPALVAEISGNADLEFEAGNIERPTGVLAFSALEVAKTGSRWALQAPFELQSKRGTFPSTALSIGGKQGTTQLILRGNEGALRGGLSGTIDLSLLELLTPSIQQAEGPAYLDLVVGGAIKEPLVSGRVGLKSGVVHLEALEAPIENIRGIFQIKQNTISVRELQGSLSKGNIRASGTVEILPQPYPKLDLQFDFNDTSIKMYPFQSIQMSGQMSVQGTRAPYQVSGDVEVREALSKERFSSSTRKDSRKSARFTPTQSGAEHERPLFELDLNIKADHGVWVKNDLFDVEMKGEVQLLNTIQTPRLLGKAELIQGKMSFRDRVFQIQSANLEFDNPHLLNPSFSLVARTELPKAKVDLIASGRMNQMKLEFSSNPVMPESEILSLLALGFTSNDLKRLRSEDRSAIQQGEAAAAIFQALDFNREVQEKTGFELQLQQSVSTQTGQSIFRQQTESDTGASPKLVIKRKISNQVDVSVGSTVGVGSTTEREGKVEVHVAPGVSVIGIWNNFEGSSTQENATSYGIDLKFQRRFK